MTNNKRLFRELQKSACSKVTLENGNCIAMEVEGIVAIENKIGLTIMKNVLYVPNVGKNLVSASQLLDTEFKASFQD